MSSEFVLVVDADLSAYRAVVEGLPPDTYDVVSVATARAGFNVACALEPLVIVASLDLPDADAMELAGVLRGHETRVAYTPLVILTTDDNEATRLAVLNAGADVVLSAPVDPQELVAQVNAMLAMSERIRELERAQSVLPPASDGQTYAVIGDPTKMSIASVLGALELEQRSGELRFSQDPSGQKLSIRVASGVLVDGQINNEPVSALDALRLGLTWTGTQFGFIASEPQLPPLDAKSLGALLLAVFAEAEPSERLSYEMEASRKWLEETANGLKLGESVAAISAAALNAMSKQFGETSSGLRLQDTAAGRRFLQDTAAGLRLSATQTAIRLGETAQGLKLTDTSAGIRVGNTTTGKVAAMQDLTSTLTSFGPTEAEQEPPSEAVSQQTSSRMRASRPDLTPERVAMRQTLRGIEVEPVKPER